MKKFDVIVMNPPFQSTNKDGSRKHRAVNLWSRIIATAIKQLKPNGILATVSPTTWLNPGRDLTGEFRVDGQGRLVDIFAKYDTYVNLDAGKHFRGVGSSFCYIIMDTSKNGGVKLDDKESTEFIAKYKFLPSSGLKEVAKQLDWKHNLSMFRIDEENDNTSVRVCIPKFIKLTADNIEILQGNELPSKTKSTGQIFIDKHMGWFFYTNTLDEAKILKKRLVDCLDILNKHCRWSGFLNYSTMRLISYPHERRNNVE